MHALDTRSEADEFAIGARVRAVVKAHGKLLGESWDAQAEHDGQVVAEVIESQGLEAGRRWAGALLAELRADCEREAGPGRAGSGRAGPGRE